MTKEGLIAMLQSDLCNEVSHQFFYLRAAVAVQGLHRHELREFFEEEAREELTHVRAFADMIAYLGGSPKVSYSGVNEVVSNPFDLLKEAARMEQEVADNYARRLQATHEMDNAATATVHVFYEEQIHHSQVAAWELQQMLTKFVDN